LFSPKEILDMAIKLEKNGETVYRQAIAKASSPQIASLLGWMADEEAQHANWFGELKSRLETEDAESFMDEMSRELFDDLLGEKNFSLQDVDFSSAEQVQEMIAVFIEFEKDTVIFYQVLGPFISEKTTLKLLQQIIDEENRHIEHLQQFLQNKNVSNPLAD